MKTQLDLSTLPVTIDYVAEIKGSDWDHDLWRVTLKKGSSYHSFDYKTGLGLRSKPKANLPAYMAVPKPVKPTVADVLHSLLSDASAANENFAEWCDNYGYDSDNMKAFGIYKACLETAVALRKYFTREQLDAIREQTADL